MARRVGWTLAGAIPLAFLGVFFAWPVATLIGRGFFPDGPFTLDGFQAVFAQDRTFEARTVQLGRPTRGMVPVISGLKPGEKIVVKGGLLLDGAANQLL